MFRQNQIADIRSWCTSLFIQFSFDKRFYLKMLFETGETSLTTCTNQSLPVFICCLYTKTLLYTLLHLFSYLSSSATHTHTEHRWKHTRPHDSCEQSSTSPLPINPPNIHTDSLAHALMCANMKKAQ